MKNITYAINRDGLVYSRVGSEVAVPVLDYEAIGRGGDFTSPLKCALQKFPVFDLVHEWDELEWTKKLPAWLKNKHRAFWGMKPLAGCDPRAQEWSRLTRICRQEQRKRVCLRPSPKSCRRERS